jgi:hypothetical protein
MESELFGRLPSEKMFLSAGKYQSENHRGKHKQPDIILEYGQEYMCACVYVCGCVTCVCVCLCLSVCGCVCVCILFAL